jgi:dTDP-glucose 4,6-dehydratase
MQDSEKYIAKAIRCIQSGDVLTVHGKDGDIGSRFYIHARNGADAVLHILNKIKPVFYSDNGNVDRPERFNVVGFDELDNLEIAKLVAELMEQELKYEFTDFHHTRPGHDRRYALCGEKLKGIGWQAPVPLRESLKTYIKWTLERPDWL